MIDTIETRSLERMACNARFIAEFRASAGTVGGRFAKGTFLILHTTGARTGRERLTPLAYLAYGCRYYVFATGPFLRRHPSWLFNLVADPDVIIEVGAETVPVTARVLTGNDRELIYRLVVTEIPQLPQWQREAGREFPIVELAPKHEESEQR